MKINDSYQSSEKSSDPTNQISKEKIQQGLDNQLQNQKKSNMSYWEKDDQLRNGRFIIKEIVGEGGFGVAYRAKDTELLRDVVIKTVNGEMQQDPRYKKFLTDFLDEGKRLCLCRHSHIVTIFDTFVEDGLPCIVMEYIEGANLRSWVQKNGCLSEEEALNYIRQIGEALIEVHKHSLVHRDVNPKNIIRKANGSDVILIDFGISRRFTRGQNDPHTVSHSDGFAPIEQYQKIDNRGPWTDVYALAATLYYLLTGKIPTPSSARRDENDILYPPRGHNQKISVGVNAAIMYGMGLYSQERPQTIGEFLDLLHLFSTSKPYEYGIVKPHPIRKQNSVQDSTETKTINGHIHSPLTTLELPSLTAAFTSPVSFLIALFTVSLSVTIWLKAGLWLVLAIVFISVYFLIAKRYRIKQLIPLFISSVIPMLIIFLVVPNLATWNPQGGGIISLGLLTILSSLLGLAVMNLYPQFIKFIHNFLRT